VRRSSQSQRLAACLESDVELGASRGTPALIQADQVKLVERDGRVFELRRLASAMANERPQKLDGEMAAASPRRARAHYGYVCQLQGPRCTGYATTVHHLVPS